MWKCFLIEGGTFSRGAIADACLFFHASVLLGLGPVYALIYRSFLRCSYCPRCVYPPSPFYPTSSKHFFTPSVFHPGRQRLGVNQTTRMTCSRSHSLYNPGFRLEPFHSSPRWRPLAHQCVSDPLTTPKCSDYL